MTDKEKAAALGAAKESNIAQGNLVRNQTVEEVLAILAKYEHFLSNPVSEIKEEVEKLKG
jgi:hypothetical protein